MISSIYIVRTIIIAKKHASVPIVRNQLYQDQVKRQFPDYEPLERTFTPIALNARYVLYQKDNFLFVHNIHELSKKLRDQKYLSFVIGLWSAARFSSERQRMLSMEKPRAMQAVQSEKV